MILHGFGVNINGTNVIINIVKSTDIPDIIDYSEHCDIVAKKDGIIYSIVAQNGTAIVKPGDEVKKDDILIAGYMDGKYTERRYVHSLGNVQAKVLYEKSIQINFENNNYIETGKKEIKYELNINRLRIKWYLKEKPKFTNFKTQTEIKKIRLAKNFYLPINIIKKIHYEQFMEEKKYNITEAIKIGEEKIMKELKQKIGDIENIVDKKVETNEVEGGVIVTVKCETLEEIGIKKIIY